MERLPEEVLLNCRNQIMKKIISIIALLIIGINVFGQSVPFLNISSDPYTYSMGGTALTLDANAFTVTSNASAMSYTDKMVYVAASYAAWQPNLLNNQILGVSGFYKTGNLAVGISGKYYTHTPYDITDNLGYISSMYTPVEMSAEAAASYEVFGGLSVGANVRFLSSALTEENKATSVAADISVSYRLKGLRASVALTNIGGNVDYGFGPHKLPSMMKAGVGYVYNVNEKNSLAIHAQADYMLNKGVFMAGVGAEYSFSNLFSARVGYHYGDKTVLPSYASAGLAVKLFGASISGAYILGFNNSPINGSYVLSLGY